MALPVRVLIVDDNPGVRRTIRAVLGDLVPVFDECSDGDQVLARFEEFLPDWVLMDVRMARVDGIEATAQLRAAHPEARIIVVSDHDQSDVRTAARRAGATGYVTKRNLMELRSLLST
jgi:two-component system response regulator DegU